MMTSAEVGAIAAALAKAQGQMRGAVKDAQNPFFKSAYAPLDTVIDAVKEALASNEIAYFQSAKAEGSKVSVVTRLLHSSGQWIESDTLEAVAKDASPQSVGSTVSYLRRYSLQCSAGIAATTDDDAESAQPRHPAHKPQRTVDLKATEPLATKATSAEAVAKVRDAIKAAKSRAEMDALAAECRKLPEAERKDIRTLYTNRLAELAGEADAEPEVA